MDITTSATSQSWKNQKNTGPATKVALFGVFYAPFLSVLIF
jgi:hypothetical protein